MRLKTVDPINIKYKKYKEKIKKEKILVLFYQLLIFVIFFSSWELASRLEWIDPLIFSSPTSIWELIYRENK